MEQDYVADCIGEVACQITTLTSQNGQTNDATNKGNLIPVRLSMPTLSDPTAEILWPHTHSTAQIQRTTAAATKHGR